MMNARWLSSFTRILLYRNLHTATAGAASQTDQQVVCRHIRPSPLLLDGLSPEDADNLSHIVAEVDVLAGVYTRFPQCELTDDHWRSLLKFDTRRARLQFLKFLRTKEEAKEKDRIRQMKARMANRFEGSGDGEKVYSGYSFHATVIDKWRNKMKSSRFIQSAVVTDDLPTIAVDCRFLKYLSPRAQSLTAMQLAFMIAGNQKREQPWPMHFVNFDVAEPTTAELKKKYIKTVDHPEHVSVMTTCQNYVDVFDRRRITYLSPDADEVLTSIKPDDVLIIGGIVDRVVEHRIPRYASLEAAQADGVRAARLPLDENIDWKSGNKFLTLTTVTQILQKAFENDGDWKFAVQSSIPQRNVKSAKEKNQIARQMHANFREYDNQVLKDLEAQLGPDHSPGNVILKSLPKKKDSMGSF